MRWVRKSSATLGIDPDRIVGAGGSAGGHLAACVATIDEFDAKEDDLSVSCRPNALVLFNPVPNVVTVMTDLPDVSERLGMDAGLAKRISPTLFVSKDTPPALLLYGTEDRFYAQGKEFVAAMKKAGNRAELFTAEGAGHGFFNRRRGRAHAEAHGRIPGLAGLFAGKGRQVEQSVCLQTLRKSAVNCRPNSSPSQKRRAAHPGARSAERGQAGESPARRTARSAYSRVSPATVSVSPTFDRWESECRLANVSPGQVTTGTPIQRASQVVTPPE